VEVSVERVPSVLHLYVALDVHGAGLRQQRHALCEQTSLRTGLVGGPAVRQVLLGDCVVLGAELQGAGIDRRVLPDDAQRGPFAKAASVLQMTGAELHSSLASCSRRAYINAASVQYPDSCGQSIRYLWLINANVSCSSSSRLSESSWSAVPRIVVEG